MILLEHDTNGNWVQIELTPEEAQKYLTEFEESVRRQLKELHLEIYPPLCTEIPSECFDKTEIKLRETKEHLFEVVECNYSDNECYEECIYVDNAYDTAAEKYKEVINERS